jgi:hypothetical protein
MADILQEGVVCCCSNLCDRSTFQSTYLPIVEFSTELSIISQSPQYPAQRKHIEKLKVKLKVNVIFYYLSNGLAFSYKSIAYLQNSSDNIFNLMKVVIIC